MKIKTKLRIVLIINIFAIALLMFFNQYFYYQESRLIKKANLISDLNLAIFKIGQIRGEYFIYKGERAKQQSYAMREDIRSIFINIKENFTKPKEVAIINNMITFSDNAAAFMDKLVKIDEATAGNLSKTQDLRERIINQLIVHAHSIYLEALKLTKMVREERQRIIARDHLYGNISLGLLALIVVSFILTILRSVALPLAKLHKGTEIIAKGNLDFKTDIKTADEIGTLSRAFDTMAERLKQTIVTKDILNVEIEERKRFEAALRESEEKFRSIFNNTIEGIFQSTPEGRYISVNPAQARIHGFESPEEMITLITDIGSQMFVYPEDRKRYREILDKEGIVVNFETELYRKDRSRIWVSANVRTVRNSEGKVLYYEGTVENITERKKAVEALKESEEKYRTMIENSVMGIFRTTPEGRYLSANPAGARMWGYESPEEMIQSVTDMSRQIYVNPEDRKRFKELVESRDHVEGFEAEFYNKDRSRIWASMNARAVRDKSGSILYYETTFENITKRKQAEVLLVESEERYSMLVEYSNDGVALVEEDNHIYVNRKFLDIFGYDKSEDIVGKTSFLVVHPDDRETVMEYNRKRQRGEPVPSKYEFKGLKKDGTSIFIEVSATKVAYHGKAASLAYFRDMTERKQFEEQLRKMSLTDELTGLYNRRGFFTLAGQQMKVAERTKKNMLLFFADLDKMKHINDSLGHQEGDNALLDVASILKEAFRDSDIIGRMGGDEFAILAIDTADETEEVLMKRLHAILDTYNRPDRKYQLSLSVGIAHYDPIHPSSLDDLMARADTLMYEDKRSDQQSLIS